MAPGEAINDLILVPVRTKVELMYDEKTSERLMMAFERGRGPTDPSAAPDGPMRMRAPSVNGGVPWPPR
jgi:hypothetical protein